MGDKLSISLLLAFPNRRIASFDKAFVIRALWAR